MQWSNVVFVDQSHYLEWKRRLEMLLFLLVAQYVITRNQGYFSRNIVRQEIARVAYF